MKNQKKAVRILALVMAVLLVLSLVISVLPVRSQADLELGGTEADNARLEALKAEIKSDGSAYCRSAENGTGF